jgi:hypothetical protein
MKYPFKYTITLTQNSSPYTWNMPAMTQRLIKMQNLACDTDAQLIEKEMDKIGLKDAAKVIETVMNKK